MLHRCQLHRQPSCLSCIVQKIRTGGGKQRASRERQAQRLRHDLHGRGRPDERARAAARAGVLLCPVELRFIDLPALISGAVHAQLLQRQKLRSGCHGPAGHHHRRYIDPGQSHEVAGHPLVAAGDINPCIKRRGVGLDLNHVGDHLPADQREIDPVIALALTVAHISSKISGPVASCFCNAFHGRVHKFVQMTGSRMAVTEGAFHEYLRLFQIFQLPAGAKAQRIQLRRIFSKFLTT